MPEVSESEAIRAFVAKIRHDLAQFTNTPVFPKHLGSPGRYCLAFAARSARLAQDLFLVVYLFVHVQGGHVTPTGYHYAFEDSNGREIIVYHWNPEREPDKPARLHLGYGSGVDRHDLQRAHIPTGCIT